MADAVDGPLRDDFDDFFRRHWLAMVRLAGLLVGDVAAAEDVAQDAFVAFRRRRATLRSAEADVSYLRTCVLNGARSVLRRRAIARKHLGAVQAVELSAARTVVDDPTAAEESDLLAAIRRLPRRQREVLVLRYWLDLPHAEIARLLAVSEVTVRSTASRALDAVQTWIEETR